mmetsp:Transcript_70149/g.141285  ORF Transcript_70149/g.141285 Transcript_70149/m.141285 type:complete len:144 (+) Transcript_70149:469-900(+)
MGVAGVVTNVTDFGAFVDINCAHREGLLHRSRIFGAPTRTGSCSGRGGGGDSGGGGEDGGASSSDGDDDIDLTRESRGSSALSLSPPFVIGPLPPLLSPPPQPLPLRLPSPLAVLTSKPTRKAEASLRTTRLGSTPIVCACAN